MSEFKDKLVNIRKNKGISQKELALRLGISPTRLNYWEKGKAKPDIDFVIRIAKELNVPINELLSEEAMELRRITAAMDGLISILRHEFDNVDVTYYDEGDYAVFLSKRGHNEITLDKREFEALFDSVCDQIPGQIKTVKRFSSEADSISSDITDY